METHYVYWYHLTSHTDPFTQGYIGVTCQLDIRHRCHLNGRAGGSKVLYNAFRKYGEDQIVKSILHSTQKLEAYALEQQYRSADRIGWNMAMGGGLPPDTTGRKDSLAVRLKRNASVRKAKAGKVYLSVFKGMTDRHSDEMRKRIGAAHKGKILSAEHRQAITDKNSGANNVRAKPICLVHKDTPSNVHRFPCVKLAADTLGVGYQALRSQAQSMFRTGTSSEPNRQGWICLTEQDAERPVEAVQESLGRVNTRIKAIPKAKGAAHAKSRSIHLENSTGEIQEFGSILSAAAVIGINEATLRYHEKRALTLQKDSNYINGWKVKYMKVLE